jgi:hypothetical protein
MLSLVLLTLTAQLSAQCDLTPTIDPPDLMMCPFTTDTLTTEEYDSYQWYKDGQPIPGATQRQLVVDYYSSVTFDFHVEVSQNGCIAQSDSTHVNGYAFLAPIVYTTGAVSYDVENDGTALFCEGDVVQLNLGLPYTENVTWFKDGEPINSASTPTLTVTGTGNYYVHAAPDVCPNLITGLGLEVRMVFTPSVKPTITPTILGALCATPGFAQYEWSRNGTVIPGANMACIEPMEQGAYTVRVLPGSACDLPSEPYYHLTTDMGITHDPHEVTVTPDHALGLLTVNWSGAMEPLATWRIVDVQGRTLRTGDVPLQGPLMVDASGLPQGMLLFQTLQQGAALAPATRFMMGQ